MYYMEIVLFIIGIALLVFGYRKTDRNILLAAAITLFFSAAIEDLMSGFTAGYTGNRNEHAIIQPQPNNSFKPTPLRGAA